MSKVHPMHEKEFAIAAGHQARHGVTAQACSAAPARHLKCTAAEQCWGELGEPITFAYCMAPSSRLRSRPVASRHCRRRQPPEAGVSASPMRIAMNGRWVFPSTVVRASHVFESSLLTPLKPLAVPGLSTSSQPSPKQPAATSSVAGFSRRLGMLEFADQSPTSTVICGSKPYFDR